MGEHLTQTLKKIPGLVLSGSAWLKHRADIKYWKEEPNNTAVLPSRGAYLE